MISSLIERTKRSAYAFKFGDFGGNRMLSILRSSNPRKACEYWVSLSTMTRLGN